MIRRLVMRGSAVVMGGLFGTVLMLAETVMVLAQTVFGHGRMRGGDSGGREHDAQGIERDHERSEAPAPAIGKQRHHS